MLFDGPSLRDKCRCAFDSMTLATVLQCLGILGLVLDENFMSACMGRLPKVSSISWGRHKVSTKNKNDLRTFRLNYSYYILCLLSENFTNASVVWCSVVGWSVTCRWWIVKYENGGVSRGLFYVLFYHLKWLKVPFRVIFIISNHNFLTHC